MFTHADSMGRMVGSICLFVHSFTQKTNDPNVFRLGIENDLGFGIERSRVGVNSNMAAV